MDGEDERHTLRRMGRRLLIVMGLVLVLGRCDLTESVEQQSLVVEAFVETGGPLPPITLRQTQEAAPFDVPVQIEVGDETTTVPLRGRTGQADVECATEPTAVTIDPNTRVLGELFMTRE